MVIDSIRLHELGLPPKIVEAARTGEELSPQAQAQVLDFIQKFETHLSDIQSRVASLQLPLQWHLRQELRKDEDDARDRLRSCHGLLSAIRRIPVEVMGEIFQLSLSSERSTDREVGDRKEGSDGQGLPVRSSLMSLCLVCRWWYAIAMTTPKLWTNITAWVQAADKGDVLRVSQVFVPGFLKSVDRFGSQPWSLTIRPSAIAFDYDYNGRISLSSLFLKHAAFQHLERLAIDANVFLIGLGDITLPRVTSVTISSYPGITNRFPRDDRLGLPSLPSLTRAVFAGSIQSREPPTKIPWSQLTHLCLGGRISRSHWRRILRDCKSLERGLFCVTSEMFGGARFSDTTPDRSVVLPHLTQLDFLDSVPRLNNEDDALGISLPSLTKVRIFANYTQSSENFSPDLFGNLTHLTIIFPPFTPSESLVETLRKFPNLRELFVGLVEDFEKLFRFLKVSEDGICHLPFLKALGIRIVSEYVDDGGENDQPPDFPYQLLQDFVASRTNTASQESSDSPARWTPTPSNTVSVQLHHLVLQVDRRFSGNVVDDVMLKLRKAIRRFTDCGLKMSVIAVGGTDSPPWGAEWTRLVDTFKHWDDGLLDFIDDAKELGVYPI